MPTSSHSLLTRCWITSRPRSPAFSSFPNSAFSSLITFNLVATSFGSTAAAGARLAAGAADPSARLAAATDACVLAAPKVTEGAAAEAVAERVVTAADVVEVGTAVLVGWAGGGGSVCRRSAASLEVKTSAQRSARSSPCAVAEASAR